MGTLISKPKKGNKHKSKSSRKNENSESGQDRSRQNSAASSVEDIRAQVKVVLEYVGLEDHEIDKLPEALKKKIPEYINKNADKFAEKERHITRVKTRALEKRQSKKPELQQPPPVPQQDYNTANPGRRSPSPPMYVVPRSPHTNNTGSTSFESVYMGEATKMSTKSSGSFSGQNDDDELVPRDSVFQTNLRMTGTRRTGTGARMTIGHSLQKVNESSSSRLDDVLDDTESNNSCQEPDEDRSDDERIRPPTGIRPPTNTEAMQSAAQIANDQLPSDYMDTAHLEGISGGHQQPSGLGYMSTDDFAGISKSTPPTQQLSTHGSTASGYMSTQDLHGVSNSPGPTQHFIAQESTASSGYMDATDLGGLAPPATSLYSQGSDSDRHSGGSSRYTGNSRVITNIPSPTGSDDDGDYGDIRPPTELHEPSRQTNRASRQMTQHGAAPQQYMDGNTLGIIQEDAENAYMDDTQLGLAMEPLQIADQGTGHIHDIDQTLEQYMDIKDMNENEATEMKETLRKLTQVHKLVNNEISDIDIMNAYMLLESDDDD